MLSFRIKVIKNNVIVCTFLVWVLLESKKDEKQRTVLKLIFKF